VTDEPPPEETPAAPPPRPSGTIRCPRCSAEVGPDQGWCLECGAPARTRLAPTPNWQLPTVAIAAIVLIAGALLAFAFVKLTGDDDTKTSAATTPVVATQPPAAPPAVQTTATTPPTATTPTTPTTPTQATTPQQATQPSTRVPGQKTPPATQRPGQTATTNVAPSRKEQSPQIGADD
jgi:hypothetical protein